MSGALTYRHQLSLEGLQGIMKSIVHSCKTHSSNSIEPLGPPPAVSIHSASPKFVGSSKVPSELLNYVISSETTPKILRELKQVKQVMMVAIEKFNTESKIEPTLRFLQGKSKLLWKIPLEFPWFDKNNDCNFTSFLWNFRQVAKISRKVKITV